ncbi:hypothetical protein V2G26_021131 [Clonostachys chloroleuca]
MALASPACCRTAAQLRSQLLSRTPTTKTLATSARTLHDRSLTRLYSTTPLRASAPNMFSYHIAASFIAKDHPFHPTTHVYHFDPKVKREINPSRSRAASRAGRPESGHDAFFVSQVNSTGSVAFGVADGVGGWVDSGVDPADFSHGLCNYMAEAAQIHEDDESGRQLTARNLLQTGYDAVCRDTSVRAGGSTACVAVARPDGTVDIANLGDSGFIHLRLNAVHGVSEPQTHAFNTPFQLSLIPPRMAERMSTYGGMQLCDLPRDADVSEHDLRHGDILLFATDGVLDNLFNQDILRVASRVMVGAGAWEMTENKGVRVSDKLFDLCELQSAGGDRTNLVSLQSVLVTQLVAAAKRASINTRLDGPFAKEVQRYYPDENWRGGKVDDICVVAAVVCQDDIKPEKSKL